MTMDTQVPVDCVQPSQDRPLGAYGKQGGAKSWGVHVWPAWCQLWALTCLCGWEAGTWRQNLQGADGVRNFWEDKDSLHAYSNGHV